MATKHTGSPWHSMSNGEQVEILGARGGHICNVYLEYNNLAEQEANAKLIEAAPELLEALQLILVHAEFWINANHPDHKAAIAAINKATNYD